MNVYATLRLSMPLYVYTICATPVLCLRYASLCCSTLRLCLHYAPLRLCYERLRYSTPLYAPLRLYDLRHSCTVSTLCLAMLLYA
jgi:hypothetical protein